jgi:hypothetical protein
MHGTHTQPSSFHLPWLRRRWGPVTVVARPNAAAAGIMLAGFAGAVGTAAAGARYLGVGTRRWPAAVRVAAGVGIGATVAAHLWSGAGIGAVSAGRWTYLPQAGYFDHTRARLDADRRSPHPIDRTTTAFIVTADGRRIPLHGERAALGPLIVDGAGPQP